MPDQPAKNRVEATELARRAPLPARSHNIVAGTAGWTDPTLLRGGLFYPPEAKSPRARLAYYARHFSMVEVDATYYTLLDTGMTERWCQATPAGFTFNIKAHPVLTGHPIDIRRLPKDLRHALEQLGHEQRVYASKLPAELTDELERRFFEPLEVLDQDGKLGAVLLQYPPWFTAKRGNAKTVERTRARYPDVSFAVEFRHKSWLEPERRQRVFDWLREQLLTYVCVDEPAGPIGGLPPEAVVTTPELAFIRFHGRNQQAWARRTATVQERFNYLYSEDELREWVQPARHLASSAAKVHAVFNNCVQDFAVLNAKGLVVLLGA